MPGGAGRAGGRGGGGGGGGSVVMCKGNSAFAFRESKKGTHDLVLPDAKELVDRADSAAGEFREENHALNVVVLEELRSKG